jgi:Flp pilus assembly protein TadG
MPKFSFRRLCKTFTKNEDGHMALMTAIGSIAILGSVALAIDLTRGINKQVNLADASDAVALLLAKSGLETDAELMAAAETHLAQLYPGPDGAELRILSINKDGDQVTVRLADNSKAGFSGILGRGDVDVSAGASAIYAQREMDIALVLDTTLSMGDPATGGGTKLDALKRSADTMVSTIESYNSDAVRMSVVPFSNYVNVGLSRRNSPWLRVDADSTTTTNVCRNVRPVTSRTNCRRETYSCDRDGVASTCSRNRCDVTYGPTQRVCGPQTNRQTWHGCVGSRNVPMDTRPGFGGNRIPGLLNARCGEELQPLTNDLDDVKTTIADMTASGNTYMPSGLMWGWRTLDSDMPLRTTDNGSDKVLILMTDGMNSRSKQGERHERRNNNADADRKTRDICESVKNDDITIYTIAYEVTDASTRALLENCASGGGNFFNARSVDELEAAFRDIGESLNELRITA